MHERDVGNYIPCDMQPQLYIPLVIKVLDGQQTLETKKCKDNGEKGCSDLNKNKPRNIWTKFWGSDHSEAILILHLIMMIST